MTTGKVLPALTVTLLIMFSAASAELVSFRRSHGGANDEITRDIFVDAAGIYTVGITSSFGPDPPNAFVTVFNADNSHRCSVSVNVGAGSADQAVALTAHAGRLYVLGTTTFGPNPPNHFVAVFDTSCNLQAFRIFDVGVGEDMRDITVEPSATPMFYIVGGQSVNGGFISKLNATLSVVWARYFQVRGGSDVANAVAFSAGRVFVAGTSNDGSSLNTFVTVFDVAGSPVAVKELAGSNNEEAFDVVVAGGNIYLAGYINYPGRQNEALIAKLDSGYSVQWIKAFGAAGSDEAGMKMTEAGGLLYFAGMTNTIGSVDVLLAAFDTDGSPSHSFMISGGPGDDIGYSVASRGSCVYPAGRHVNWPLFYVVFDGQVNTVAMTINTITPSTTSITPSATTHTPAITSYTPTLDTGAAVNSFYSRFCPDTLVSTTTSTVTSTVGTTITSTLTTTSTTTAYAISTTTFTTTSSVILVVSQTTYTTIPVTTTQTIPTTTTQTATVSTTTTATNTVTTTQSTTQTITTITTVAFAEPVSTYILPMLLLLIAVLIAAAVVVSRRRSAPAEQSQQSSFRF